MHNTRTVRLILAAAALAAIPACDDATGPGDTEEPLVLADLAAVAADAVVEDVSLMGQPFAFGAGTAPWTAGPGGPGGGHPGPGEPGGHHGIGGDRSGTRVLTFFDAAGNEQDAYDPLTTASIHTVVEMAGQIERPRWSGTMERTRDLTITGLEGEETTRTFNGFGEEAMSRVRSVGDGTARTYEMTGSFTKTDVVVPVPGSGDRWPLSGTVHRVMSVTVTGGPNGDFTREMEVTITFDGDETANAVINGEPFEIDLSARPGGDCIRSGFGRSPGG